MMLNWASSVMCACGQLSMSIYLFSSRLSRSTFIHILALVPVQTP